VSIPLKDTAFIVVGQFWLELDPELPDPGLDAIDVPPLPKKTPLMTPLGPAEFVMLIWTWPAIDQMR
jgi:hypothetical protein